MSAATQKEEIRPSQPYPCGHWYWLNIETGETRPYRCNRWTCPDCRPQRRAFWVGRILSARPERHVVFTSLPDDPDRLRAALAHIIQAIRRAEVRWSYMATTQRTQRGDPHVHMLQRGDYLPVRKLSRIAAAHGAGPIVWIRAVDYAQDGSSRAVALYVTRHLLRADPHGQPRPTARRIRSSRDFFPPVPEPPAPEGSARWWQLHRPHSDEPGWGESVYFAARPPEKRPGYIDLR